MSASTRLRAVLRSALVLLATISGSGIATAAQRTFVSTGGSDLNVCSLAAPCRGFAKAITVTDPGGELVVLDSGGYGSVTVNQNVTIVSPSGVYAGISVFAATDGVTVTAPATKVVLRGLSINGQGGNHGIRVQAGEVHVESTVISNMAAAGILVEGGTSVRISGTVARSNVDGLRVVPGAGPVSVLVRDSEFSHNAGAGIGVAPSAVGTSALVTVERSSVTKNGAGVVTSPGPSASSAVVVTQSVASENTGAAVSSTGVGATVWVRESAITRNGTGLLQAASGVLNACGANLLVANGMATSGAINTGSCLDVATASGTVSNVATGAGLSGGPITGTGTINLAATNLLPTVACGNNQIPKWNGAAWACAGDNDTNSGGTVTQINSGTGLTGGPISTTGTVSIAIGGVGTTQLADGSVDVSKLDTTSTDARYAKLGGNDVGLFVSAVLGTTNNRSLELHVNSTRVMRFQPDPVSPNVIGGNPNNTVTPFVRGATIGGGGAAPGDSDPDFLFEAPNVVTDHYGTVGGGYGNRAGDGAGLISDSPFATVGGGSSNIASGTNSTVGGGYRNTAGGLNATAGGGHTNTASADNATVGGGNGNFASGAGATVGGGVGNTASGIESTVSGGVGNDATGDYSTVAGGLNNLAQGDYSFAAGRNAQAVGNGAFAFADSNPFGFGSSTANAFRVRATGGVRFVTDIDGTGNITWSCLTVTGTGWSCSSDRNLKQDLVPLDGSAVLEKLAAMPVYAWSPKGRNAHVRHYGPMAQDFHTAFGLGDDETMIGMQDAEGVALAAIQGLHQLAQEKDATIRALSQRVAELESLRDEVAVIRNTLSELRDRPARLADAQSR